MVMQVRLPLAADLQLQSRIVKGQRHARIMPDLFDLVRAQIGVKAQTALLGIKRPQHDDARQRPAIQSQRGKHRRVEGRPPVLCARRQNLESRNQHLRQFREITYRHINAFAGIVHRNRRLYCPSAGFGLRMIRMMLRT